MTTEQVRIDPKIAAHVDAALAAGFTVYALPDTSPRPVGFVAVCLTEDGPFAHIQVPTHNWDPVSLDVPIKPSREYGSGVLVDHDGTPEDAVRALRKACLEDMVTVRFMRRKRGDYGPEPVVPNHGRNCIENWPGGTAFTKLGKRGTNWTVPQLAGRLEIGDRFDPELTDGRDFGTLTVAGRKYGGPNWDMVTLTVKELDHPIEMAQRQFVTLLGGA